MIKKSIVPATLALAIAATISGCAIKPTAALIYTNTTSPFMATATKGTKTGVSEKCTNVMGIVATGDCSIANAAKNGNINTVSTVDWKGTNVLGIYSTGSTVVTGE